MIAIIDYGMGNLRSVQKACEYVGYDARITADKQTIRDASHVILPGVGAARDALQNLRERGLFDEAIRAAESGKPFLGICLGMQLLFDRSLENGEHECLGLVPGEVVPFRVNGLRVPTPRGWKKGISSPHVNTDIRLQRRCAGGMSLAPSSIPKRAATRELR